MNIINELKTIIDMKKGNKELAIFYMGEYDWSISLGNPTNCVMLGEADGEIEVESCNTLEEAITELRDKLETFNNQGDLGVKR